MTVAPRERLQDDHLEVLMAVVIEVDIMLKEKHEGAPEVPMLFTLDGGFRVRSLMSLDEQRRFPILERALETKRISEWEALYWERNMQDVTTGPMSLDSASRMGAFAQNYVRFELTGPYALERDAGVKVSVGLRHGTSSPLVFLGHIIEIISIQQHTGDLGVNSP